MNDDTKVCPLLLHALEARGGHLSIVLADKRDRQAEACACLESRCAWWVYGRILGGQCAVIPFLKAADVDV